MIRIHNKIEQKEIDGGQEKKKRRRGKWNERKRRVREKKFENNHKVKGKRGRMRYCKRGLGRE